MKKTSTRVLLMFAALALFIVPVVAFAAAGFTDVDDDSVFVADIQWMKDNGITKGCNPPTNDKFCPKNNVTREQMSAFMHRLAIEKVVDAATAAHADHATEADDADTLDGFSSENLASRAAMVDYDGANTDPLGEIRATVTIEAPAQGILIANTTGDTFEGTGLQKCYILVNGVQINASNGWVDHDQGDDIDCITGATVAVAAGPHTVELRFVGDANNDGTLTVLWVPFDGTGAVPASASPLGAPDGR